MAPVMPFCGVPVYYYRCTACELIFATAFDAFSHDDFSRVIYNADYSKVDGEYAEARPQKMRERLSLLLSRFPFLRILDYGCGNGRLAELLKEAGFPDVDCYDPMVPAFSKRPTRKYNVVLAFEVVEHSPTPRQTFADLASFMDDESLLIFSTLTPPPDITIRGGSWWYLAPRNGHVTIYSMPALARFAAELGLQVLTGGGEETHLWCRKLPYFVVGVFTEAARP